MDLFQHAEAQKRRDIGMSRASIAQEFNSPGYGQRLYEAILSVAMRQEFVFVDDVAAIFTEQPSSPNSNGAPWLRAVNDGILERTDRTRPSSQPRKHLHRYTIYRSNIFNK